MHVIARPFLPSNPSRSQARCFMTRQSPGQNRHGQPTGIASTNNRENPENLENPANVENPANPKNPNAMVYRDGLFGPGPRAASSRGP